MEELTKNDVAVASQTSLPTVAVKQNSSSDVIPRVIPQRILPNPFPSKKSIVTPKPSAEVIAVKTKPRTKGVIIGFSDGESDDDDEQSIDEEM